MLTFPAGVKLYLATEPTDLRKSFNGLSLLVEQHFGLDAMAGHLFVFLNRRANQVRILFWDRDGFCIVAKKLERGTFRRNRQGEDGQTHLQIDAADLALLLEGIEIKELRRSPRYMPPSRDTRP
jgi:transposase